jgi:hypothetical protein
VILRSLVLPREHGLTSESPIVDPPDLSVSRRKPRKTRFPESSPWHHGAEKVDGKWGARSAVCDPEFVIVNSDSC